MMSTPSGSASGACIAGIGQSEFTRWRGIADRSQFQITSEAVPAALDDAGLTASDVDGSASFSNDSHDAPLTQVARGVPEVRWSSMVWVADPLRLFHCCLETDGACAVVVTTRH